MKQVGVKKVLSNNLFFKKKQSLQEEACQIKNIHIATLQALLTPQYFSLLSVLLSCKCMGMCFPWMMDAHAS